MVKARTLMRHQAKALRYANRRDTNVALFLAMRLGKTLTTIHWARRKTGQVLVVAPLSCLHAWQDELLIEGIDSIILDATTRKHYDGRLDNIAPLWYLVNYEGLSRRRDWRQQSVNPSFVAEHPWTVVILDESALIRNPKAVRSKICCKYLNQAKYKAILSGLPNPESSLDFFQQMIFLRDEFMGCKNFWEWRVRYFVPDRFGYTWAPKPGIRKLIREAVKSRACIMSKKQVGLDNKHIHECRYVFLPPTVMRKYKKLVCEFAINGESTKWAVVRYAWLRRIASGCKKTGSKLPFHAAKTNELLNLLEGELSKEQVIVWYCFKAEGDAIEASLFSAGISVARISGKTPIKIRQLRRMRLMNKSVRVLVMQVACGQYGLDLSAASTAVYFSEPPSHEQYAQSKERIEHPKKKEPLLSVSLIAKDTVDEDIHAGLQLKCMSSQSMLRGLIEKLRRKVG